MCDCDDFVSKPRRMGDRCKGALSDHEDFNESVFEKLEMWPSSETIVVNFDKKSGLVLTPVRHRTIPERRPELVLGNSEVRRFRYVLKESGTNSR
ncbi:hypothetical protein TNCV_1795171 [Trichonephila clavipes]|nr:hypothetical protein TNCV_1795171 [Trichonephila clavipes]